MDNSSLIFKLKGYVNEDFEINNIESIIRKLLSEEEQATANYLKAANKIKNENTPSTLKIVKVFEDIANEEKVHIGELQKCLSFIGISNKNVEQGKKEAKEIL